MKKSREEVLGKFREIHGDNFDYSQFDYKGSNIPATIICPKHGPFKIRPLHHIQRAQGCPICSGKIRWDLKRFILLAKEKHGSKYDYSHVKFINPVTKVKILCLEHGFFEQTPKGHIHSKGGCLKCSGVNSTDLKTFIQTASSIHEDYYDYSRAIYINCKTKLEIVCPKHGTFYLSPNSHLNGAGCKKCAIDNRSSNVRLSTNDFILRSKQAHGDKYDYSKVRYFNSRKKVEIICPEHGSFWKRPEFHYKGSSNGGPQGCKKCSQNVLDNESFIKRAKQIHGEKYDYSKVIVKGIHNPVEIICPEHGLFTQNPAKHLFGNNNKPQGCRICGSRSFGEQLISLKGDSFIDRAKHIHGNKYSYENVIYQGATVPVVITCKSHGQFEQTPQIHLQGSGCTACTVSGFNNNAPSIVYYLRIELPHAAKLYKIGISNHGVLKRFPQVVDQEKITIIKTWSYEKGIEAKRHEYEVLKEHKNFQYHGPDVLSGGGNTELFIKDVLLLDQ